MKKSKSLHISFLGAAKTVTGSMHLLEAEGGTLLVDCGLVQGRRKESQHANRHLPAAATSADAVVLTHAHIDHCGNLPGLVKAGFKKDIHCTAATADLCHYMLLDAAHIQESDAAWLNRKHGQEAGWEDIVPLFTQADARAALERLVPHAYGEEFEPIAGVKAHLIDSGHILGSATVVLDVKAARGRRRVVFSGDIGRRNLPILRDPTPPKDADYVVMESTYGNRQHAAVEEMHEQLLEAIESTRKRGGKVIIPSFSLERTQEIVYALNELRQAGRLGPIPVYLDSPLAVSLTEVFRRHHECFDAETTAFDKAHGDPFGFDMLHMVTSLEESKALNGLDQPAVIISASGMCEAGRIVHHLRNNIEDSRNTVLIVGYQAQHTLGRRLVEGRDRVKIFGVERDVRARIRVLNAFSAHADRNELLWWAKACGKKVKKFFLVHGDEDQCEALGKHLEAEGRKAFVPSQGERVEI
ncbi:MAG: MBL fold metallo-hydrolase [Myxococcota bacterium]|jgi:metallo-beta-lactamase family protein|nr:MBL fold metallo-hydrolase [Myxococcota bacterium]